MTTKKAESKVQAISRKGSILNQIFRAITGKGWSFYKKELLYRQISFEEMMNRGPVDCLKLAVPYSLFPKVNSSVSRNALSEECQVVAHITIPFLDRLDYPGKAIYQVSEEKRGDFVEYLIPGGEIDFTGIELGVTEVKLFSQRTMPSQRKKTEAIILMPYSVFQAAIPSLKKGS